MVYYFGKQDFADMEQAQAHCFLLTNGLGGYASQTKAWSVSRCDQGILTAAVRAPNLRITLVHRMREQLTLGDKTVFLSSQAFAGRQADEEGYRALSLFEYGPLPVWTYELEGVIVKRTMAMAQGSNTVAIRYEIDNGSRKPCTLRLEPVMKFAPKETALEQKKRVRMVDNQISDGECTLYIHTAAAIQRQPLTWERLSYPEDRKDGRPDSGMAFRCCDMQLQAEPGRTAVLDVVLSTEETVPAAGCILERAEAWQHDLETRSGFRSPLARTLAAAADAYLVRRDSTGGKTIVAGYPLFSDWGRDTMIALSGCCLSTGRYADAKSILRTFLAYEKDGLVPNLFPEGESEPMYNTVDAALLLIDCIWQYVRRTEDLAFVREAWPVMQRIIAAYRRGTSHGISMDTDGLIRAGQGLDQVTWMDVCINGVLPTPRHGKPVEINAYWYNALRIMDALACLLNLDAGDYAALAEKVKASFVEKFYIPEKGYLRDVLSGTGADEQIRCNQIWAVSMAFTMLSPAQEKQVVETVERHLYTPCGLRTLSPEDPEYRGEYGGDQFSRDMAYHQGTVWPFPMGAFYRAYLKVNGHSRQAVQTLRRRLKALEPMLREGCLGQLPEIYSGDFPAEGKGCFAQAWSVGELLRVLEELERLEA